MNLAITEAEFLDQVTTLCDWLRLLWHHETDSRRTKAGFLDLVIVGNTVVYVELKTQTGRLTPDQHKWIDALRHANAEVHIWRPEDWPGIQKRLKELAK